jgi:hypothetical protein
MGTIFSIHRRTFQAGSGEPAERVLHPVSDRTRESGTEAGVAPS